MKAQFNIKDGLLGDGCLPEPALHAFAMRNGGEVAVHVGSPAVASLYMRHPTIRLADEPGEVDLDPTRAFWWAVEHQSYFSAGYWPQLGMPHPRVGERLAFRVHKPLGRCCVEDGRRADRVEDRIVLCPHSRSCTASITPGARPNKAVPLDWWYEVFDRLVLDRVIGPHTNIQCLGGSSDPAADHPLIRNDFRGCPISHAADLILSARLLITVETWANIVAADKAVGRTLFMSAATPTWFIAPPGAAIVRAAWPDEWGRDETVEKIKKLLI